MATYVPGAQSYYPEFKPFTPDYKFLSGVLDVRTDRYNTNYKAINDAYGKVVYADLSRNDTQEIRDQYANQLTPKLQQISGMDLSIQQNADAANALFKPFYENNLVVKDMVATKNYKKELAYADGLLNSPDRKIREQYWQTGIKAMNYQMQDFINAAPEEALQMQLPKYVQDADLSEMAMDLLKTSGLSVTKDITTGDWIITQKNGSNVTDSAYEYVKQMLLDDPKVTNAYYTDAYVKQREFVDKAVSTGMYQDSAQAKEAWAKSIMDDIAGKLQEKVNENKKILTDAETVKNNWDNYAQTTGIIPGSDEEVKYTQSIAQYDALLKAQSFNEELLKEYTQPATDPTSYSNKAFNMLMSYNINDDLKAAARLYSMKDASMTVKINPYKEIDVKFRNDLAMEEIQSQNRMKEKAYEKSLENPSANPYINNLLDAMNGGLGGAETSEFELSPDTDIVSINNIDHNKRLIENADAKIDFIKTFHESLEALKGKDGKPQMITYDTKDGEVTSDLNTATKKLKEPGNEAYLSKLYLDYNKKLDGAGNNYPSLVADDNAYLNIVNKRDKAEELSLKAIAATNTQYDVYYKNLKAAKNTKYGEFLKDYEKQGVPLYMATPYERALQEQQLLKKQNPNAEAPLLIPESGNNVKANILTKEQFIADYVKRAKAGLIFDKDGTVKSYEARKETKRKDEFGVYITVPGVTIEDKIKEDAIETYNAQKSLLNKTLNGALNTEASREGYQTAEVFIPFSREQYYRGIPVERMTVGNLSTYPVYKTFVSPANVQQDQNVSGELTTFFNQYNNTPTGNVYDVDLGKQDKMPAATSESAKKLLDQITMDLRQALVDPKKAKESSLSFTLAYAPVYGPSKEPNKTSAAYIITVDQDYINKFNTGKSAEDPTRITNNVITFAFDQTADMNPKNKSEYNFSAVQSKIQMSEDKSYRFTLPDAGSINVYQEGNYWKYTTNTQIYDPKTGSMVTDFTTTPRVLTNSAGAPVKLNDLDRTVNGLKQGLKDLYQKNTDAKNLNKQKIKNNN